MADATSGMSVGRVTTVAPDLPVATATRGDRSRTAPGWRWLLVALVVVVLVVTVVRWPEPPPPALLPDAVGATPRAPGGPVASRWARPQEGAVQHLDVVDDLLVVLDLHRTVVRDDARPPSAQRLRVMDVVDGAQRWQHRMAGNEAVVLVDQDGAVTSVVPSALGTPAVVVALDVGTGLARWRTAVRDVDGVATDGRRIVAHGADGCVELGVTDGIPTRRLDGGRCLPSGGALARAGSGGWELWRDGRAIAPPVPGAQPPVPLDDGVVRAADAEVVATTLDGATDWRLSLDAPAPIVRPFPALGVRVDGPRTSTIVSPDGRVVAEVPWWYRGIVDDEGLVFLDVPTDPERTSSPQVRVVGTDGRVLAATRMRAGVEADDPGAPDEVGDPGEPTSASAAVAARVGPSMFCPPVAVTCRARRWPAVRMTADGVLMEHDGALGLHALRDLVPRWQVDLDGARVEALAAGPRGVVALVTTPDARVELRGFA